MTEKIHRSCILCCSEKIQPLYRYYEVHKLVYCPSCGFIFMENEPSQAELDKHYAQYSYASEREVSAATVASYNLLLDQFEPYRKTNRLLDVGCGRGWFLDEAQKRGWEVSGSEYSETAVGICRAKDIEMYEGPLDTSIFKTRDFDVVTSFEVIEHVTDPNQKVAAIAEILREGGLFYCTTPNFNSLQRFMQREQFNIISYPEHLGYFTKQSLHHLMNRHALRKRKLMTTGVSLVRLRPGSPEKRTAAVALRSDSVDEKLRVAAVNKKGMRSAKAMVNTLLSATGTGLTLKAFYEKSSDFLRQNTMN